MLAMADREGFIYASVNGLARAACLEPDDVIAGLDILVSPDTESSDLTRNPENEGRRIEKIDGGWKIINYSYYRDLQDADERRYQNKMRKRKSRSVTAGHASSPSVTQSHASESESESTQSQSHTKKENTGTGRFAPPSIPEVRAYAESKGWNVDATMFVAHYTANGWKVGKNPMKNWKAAVYTWTKRE